MTTKILLLLGLLCWLSLLAPAQLVTLPAKTSGFTDSAVFDLYKYETLLGTIEYRLAANGSYYRKFDLFYSGQKVGYELQISCDSDGYWQKMTIKAPGQEIPVIRKGNEARYIVKGKNYSARLVKDHILYESYGPVFESLMLRQYDLKTGGEQSFPRFLIPSKTVVMTVAFRGKEMRTLAGKKWTFYRFDATFLGLTLEIWADRDNKIYLMRVPIQNAAYVRRGFKPLLQPDKVDPLLSQADFDFSKKTVMMPMRDGVKLATDLYLPKKATERLPVILIRTPYHKGINELTGKILCPPRLCRCHSRLPWPFCFARGVAAVRS